MENRGRKRSELVEQLPADKRACSLLEYQPGSSSSSPRTPTASKNHASQPADFDMESSSSASFSGRSEGEAEKESAYGSCDSDGMEDTDHRQHIYREFEFQRRSSKENEVKLNKILPNLEAGAGPSSQLAGLTELCDILSLSMDDRSLANLPLESFIANLVRLTKHESSPDVMLLAIRALGYLSDIFPRSSGFLVRHNAVSALCERLMVIEYLDVAEQSLQALEKLSRDHPVTCLKAGAIMAVLSYIDFFSTSIQRVAVSTVANVCKKLPSDCSSLVMEAVPVMCNLLQYEDQKLVEVVSLCLIRITECLSDSSEMLDELCKHGVIHQSLQLIASSSQMTLTNPTYTGLIGMLSRLASGSFVAVRTLFDLNISAIMRGILSNSDLSNSMPYFHLGEMPSNQVCEVLNLLNELLPPLARDGENIDIASQREKILADQPELLLQFGMDILPILVEVVGSGANSYVYYGCLSIITKLVYFSTADILLGLFKTSNISSFLAGVFSQKDHHLLISALKTAEIVMQKLPDVFLNSFVKEGVVYAINALAIPQEGHSVVSNYKTTGKDSQRCLCHAFNSSHSRSSSDARSCKLEKDSVCAFAKQINETYFASESRNSEIGLTESIKKLRAFCAVLTDHVDVMSNKDYSAHQEEYLSHIVDQIMQELRGGSPMSTFEFIESGVLKSLAHYLSGGKYSRGSVDNPGLSNHYRIVLRRFDMFARAALSSPGQRWEDMPLTLLVRKLQSALSSLGNFPVILSQAPRTREVYANIPSGRYTKDPCLRVRFMREEGETVLCNFSSNVLTVEAFASFDAIEGFLWPKVSTSRAEHHQESTGKNTTEMTVDHDLESDLLKAKKDCLLRNECAEESILDQDTQFMKFYISGLSDKQGSMEKDANMKTSDLANDHSFCNSEDTPKLLFYLEGKQLDHSLTFYQAILRQVNEEPDVSVSPKFWYEVYEVKYRRALEQKRIDSHVSEFSSACNELGISWKQLPFLSTILAAELPCHLDKSNPAYDILFLLNVLEGLNRFSFHVMSHERSDAFAKGRIDNLDDLKVIIPVVPQMEFLSSKLTEKLEQQMRDPLALAVGGMPSWCSQLMAACPFLFAFEIRRKYFRLATFGPLQGQPYRPLRQWSSNNSSVMVDRRSHAGSSEREKFKVFRSHILDSAAEMMALHARSSAILEVEYNEEVGSGLGPTMEFYTLVSHEFQKVGLGMWREEQGSSTDRLGESSQFESKYLVAPLGLFPRPWSATSTSSNGKEFADVIQKFVLLGQVVAKALQDGRVLDLPFSKAFYKVILGQDLHIYDIQSFDPELGRTLLEFQALADRRRNLVNSSGKPTTSVSKLCFRNTSIEDLCLDFTLSGYTDYTLAPGHDCRMVTIDNLEEYISLTVDATVRSGISRQVEAFKSGFNQVFPLKNIQIFTEDEIERLLCGEHESWASGELLDHIKFDHGYTATSPPIVNLLEIVQDFGCNERRAFLQFVTGAPRLPPGGLASLNPKLTIVRKHWSNWEDADLPSVMTCANYLKLPPYTSKEKMKERLLYAITEGQGSFHLS